MTNFSQFIIRLSGNSRAKIALAWGSFFLLAVPAALAIAAGAPERLTLSVLALLTLFAPCLLFIAIKTRGVAGPKSLYRASRLTIQYALARYSAMLLILAPLAFLSLYLYSHRDRPLANLPLSLAAIALLGLALLRYRRTILDLIDRRFFREQYDARQTLTLLIERIRSAGGSQTLAKLIAREIDAALHVEAATLFVLDPLKNAFFDVLLESKSLDASSPLASLISTGILELDSGVLREVNEMMPQTDRDWTRGIIFNTLVPILARDGLPLGFIALGKKRSGLRLLREDRRLLTAVASQAAWVLELELARPRESNGDSTAFGPSTTPGARDAGIVEPAKECMNCGCLYSPYTVFCAHCSRRLEVSAAPYILPGRFRFERRIGTGGMGVVYRAVDVALGRAVAVKTLHELSPDLSVQLRAEARTTAYVSSPHLASIFGIETWNGTPLLILELLEGGTLAQRLQRETLSPKEAIDLGIAMTEALIQLHEASVLHRDIKPSNIGYTLDNRPKLMDFGISRLHSESFGRIKAAIAKASEDSSETTVRDASHLFTGTLPYLSPEILKGGIPSQSDDLWALSAVLFEALTGHKIFEATKRRALIGDIKNARTVAIGDFLPGSLSLLSPFFHRVLGKKIELRPHTAIELKELLVRLRHELEMVPNIEEDNSFQA